MNCHKFEQDRENPTCLTWTELHKNNAALLSHLVNLPVFEYLIKHAQFEVGFSIQIQGTVENEFREAIMKTGLPLRIFETACGHSRI